uniref:Uncharacterized protein n=1 Tax=Periophthalmus magnuspinnatus TaxID=409849 RepID=A0A3B4ACJ4_9GOBI
SGQLSAYKDAKSFGQGLTYHGEEPLSLTGAIWEILSNYKKKKHHHVLGLSLNNVCVFQEELQRWSQAMDRALESSTEAPTEEGPSGAKSQTLPPVSTSTPEPGSAKKDKEKMFSRFAKKK